MTAVAVEDLRPGLVLLDAEGDRWEVLDGLPDPLPVGRQWLRESLAPWLRMVGSNVVMPWADPDPMQSALRRYGPFTVAPPEPEPPPAELADFHPANGHRHDCPNVRRLTEAFLREDTGVMLEPCRCAALLYALLEDAEHPRPADPTEGPDDGHTFRIRVSSRGSYGVVGEPHHTDSAEFHDVEPFTLEVRAWDLPAALRRAHATPLHEWTHPGA